MKKLLLIACLVTGLTPVMLARSAWLHRGQGTRLLTCSYHAWRAEQDALHGSTSYATYQAYRSAHSCSALLGSKHKAAAHRAKRHR